jgi:hypothetical protein
VPSGKTENFLVDTTTKLPSTAPQEKTTTHKGSRFSIFMIGNQSIM